MVRAGNANDAKGYEKKTPTFQKWEMEQVVNKINKSYVIKKPMKNRTEYEKITSENSSFPMMINMFKDDKNLLII